MLKKSETGQKPGGGKDAINSIAASFRGNS